ncbi:MAG: type II toxin-antitoxin system prevent-host-death family antitoxin [Betaproteobacteria bacterium]|nr:type II toxin-antitoxin system prevent-host-death family antitoxin [Betaproteobacteria bacterium]
MSANWPLKKAKNEFSRVVELAMREGPQTVTIRL